MYKLLESSNRKLTRSEKVDLLFPGRGWSLYSSAPLRPTLRAALEDRAVNEAQLRWKNGRWVLAGSLTPRSEALATCR